MRKVTTVTLEGGVAFFEDGTEASGVSVRLIKAAPALLKALRDLLEYTEDSALAGASENEPGMAQCRAAHAAIAQVEN